MRNMKQFIVFMVQLKEMFEKAEIQGEPAGPDTPEGARYIVISEKLKDKIVKKITGALNVLRRRNQQVVNRVNKTKKKSKIIVLGDKRKH